MSYPGNPSLAPETQERTQKTFEQSLDLAAQGKDQEALAGCEFILGLDPLFRPAQKLQERLQSPERPVQVDDLRLAGGDDATLELDPLDGDDLEPLDLGDAEIPVAPAAPASGLATVLQDLLDKGNYQQVLQIAETQQEAIAQDPQLQQMVGTARTAASGSVAPEEEPLSLGGEDDGLSDLQTLSLSIDSGDDALDDDLPGLDDDLTLAAPGLDEDLPELDDDLSFDTGSPAAGSPAASVREDALGDEFPLGGDEDLDEGSRDRIQELLDEGQGIFESGDYQGAIDVWSRIFLIDVSNGQASERIETARQKKAELERQAEEKFHEAAKQIEEGELDEAKAILTNVLELDPNHSTAQDYLDQLEAGKVPTVVPRSTVDLDEPMGMSADADIDGEDVDKSMEAAVQRDRVVVVKKTDKKLIALAAAVAVLVIGGGVYLFLNKDKLFPNSEAPVTTMPPRIDPIARATQLYESGDTENALEALRSIPSGDPAYEQAQAQISQWEAMMESGEGQEPGPPPELMARREQLLQAARQAHQLEHFIRARKYFDRAARIKPLGTEDLLLMKNCDIRLDSLAQEIDQFQAAEYAAILPNLWRKLDDDADNPDIHLLIVDSYYNLALNDLQKGDPRGAAEKLRDVLPIAGNDEDLMRLHLFAKTYTERPQDLLYRIFVKYLPTRGWGRPEQPTEGEESLG